MSKFFSEKLAMHILEEDTEYSTLPNDIKQDFEDSSYDVSQSQNNKLIVDKVMNKAQEVLDTIKVGLTYYFKNTNKKFHSIGTNFHRTAKKRRKSKKRVCTCRKRRKKVLHNVSIAHCMLMHDLYMYCIDFCSLFYYKCDC